MKRLLGFIAAIAALTYFLDPRNGAGRRNTTRDRALAFFRQTKRKADDVKVSAKAKAKKTPVAEKAP